MTPQLRPEMWPKTRLAGHLAAGPRSEKRAIRARSRLTSACHVVGRVARNSGGLLPFPFGQGTTWISNQLSGACASGPVGDRKSTRLNSSHGYISYAVFCLKKKKRYEHHR